LARTDDGEFELVLGNLQLISVFLIVVILLGVFFSMGYIVGRNSAPPAIADARTQTGKPIVVEPPTRPSTDQPASSAAQPATSEPAPETKPARNPPVVEKKEVVKSEPPPAPAPAPERKPEPASARGAVTAVDRPTAGRYWQVVSTSRPEAEIIAGAISKKGLKSIVAPAPKEGFYRVLVGPLEDPAEIAKTRTELESAGFKNPILQKY
jgi:cell division protein FtsN